MPNSIRIPYALVLAVTVAFHCAAEEPNEKAIVGTAMGVYLGAQLKGLTADLDMDVVINSALEFANGTGKHMDMQEKMKMGPRIAELQAARLSGKPEEKPLNAEEKDKLAHLEGEQLAPMITMFNGEFDPEALKKSLISSAKGEEPTIKKQDLQTALQKAFARAIERSQKEGVAFLEENKKKEDVKTTESGLQYKVLTEGKGPKPEGNDKVTTHYKGTLVNGRQFDSSYDRGQPTTFAVNGVIAGWTEALKMMPEGSKWQLFIPSNLAYKEKGEPRAGIPPNAALIFDIELIKVTKAAAPTAPAIPAAPEQK